MITKICRIYISTLIRMGHFHMDLPAVFLAPFPHFTGRFLWVSRTTCSHENWTLHDTEILPKSGPSVLTTN